MQDTAVQLNTTTSAKSSTKTGTKTSSSKSNSVDASKADPFLQMMMTLLGQNDTTAADTTADSGLQATDLLSLIQSLGTSDSSSAGSTANGTASALMQLLAGSGSTATALESLADGQSASTQDLFTEFLQMLTSQSAQSTGTADGTGLLQQLGTLMQNGTATALDSAQLTALLNSQRATVQPQSLTTDTVNAATLADVTALKSVESAGTDTNDSDTDSGLLSQQQSYSRTIAKAKELLTKSANDTDKTADADKVDGSTLTASKTASPFEIRLQAAAKGANTSLAQQVETGIKESLNAGKSEFTIKLKPENLGEITVKLTEEAGKSVLTITTASASTAKLLNSDLDSLKAAMAPLNVRVNETVTQTAASQQGSSQQFDMAGQQFAGQQQQQQFARQFMARQNTNYYGASYRGTAQDDSYAAAAAAGTAARVAVSGLDAYV